MGDVAKRQIGERKCAVSLPVRTVDDLIRELHRFPGTLLVTIYDPSMGGHREPILHRLGDEVEIL